MSVAFYKDKMVSLLDTVADLSFDRITEWKRDYAGQPDKEFLIIRQPSDLIMNCIQSCVFGQSELDKTLSYIADGREVQLTLGQFMKEAFHRLFMRNVGVLRSFTTILDKQYVTKYEREI